MTPGIFVKADGDDLAITFPFDQILVEKVKGMPQRRWDKANKRWKFKPTLANIEYVQKWFPDAEWGEDTFQFVEDATGRKARREETAQVKAEADFDFSLLDDVPFKLPPLDHQKIALLLGRDEVAFAYLMDQGTGKTKVLIDDAAHNWRQGRIDGLIVFAPNSVKSNWVDPEDTFSQTNDPNDMDEITKHMAPDVPVNKGAWVSSPNKREKKMYAEFKKRWGEENVLHILVINIEAMHVKRVFEEALAFTLAHKCMATCDESTRIKNRAARRTKNAVKVRDGCILARIMSGTPLIKSPLDAFAQFRFLDEDIIGYSNYYTFRNHFAVMGGFNGYQVLFYQNLEELSDKINAVSYRVLKKDCLNLPPQVYLKRKVDLTREQASIYSSMRDSMIVDLSDYGHEGEVNATIVLTQLLRLQQITGGYVPQLDGNGEQIGIAELIPPERNPKFTEVMEIIDESGDQKVIVWCRFREEIAGLAKLLAKRDNEFGFLEFHGGISTSNRREVRKEFFSNPRYKVMIANQDAGGIGLDEFKVASIAVYLSNSYSTEGRVQSEDRTHRIGSEVHDLITYYDVIANKTVDSKVITSLRDDVNISAQIMKDGWREWI